MPQRANPPASRSSAARPDARATNYAATSTPHSAQVRRALNALSLGALSVAVIGGLACYALLLGWGLAGWLAGVIGLVFALLARTALVGLGREWLLAQARVHGGRDQAAPSDVAPDTRIRKRSRGGPRMGK